MATCFSILPERFEDRRWENIITGFARLGYRVEHNQTWRSSGLPAGKVPADDRDILVTWTRNKGRIDHTCSAFEDQGGRVVVCEEAHIRHPLAYGRGGVVHSEQHFAISVGDHQGGTNCPVDYYRGPTSRWRGWNIAVQPWRFNEAGPILVREQRGIGSPRCAAPSPEWHIHMARRISQMTSAEIMLLEHPKKQKRRGETPKHTADLVRDARCLVTWNSHTGSEAIIEGVPVVAYGPFFMRRCAFVSFEGFREAEREESHRTFAKRDTELERLAWTQFSHSELKSGWGLEWIRQ